MAQQSPSFAPGMAVFSTRNGKYAQRQVVPHMNIVIRSDPVEDRDTMAAKLINEFPVICKSITAITSPHVSDFFDGYDQELHGYQFLCALLVYIAQTNATQAGRIQEFVGRWMASNKEAFVMMTMEHHLEQLFTQEDIQEYGEEFLEDALVQVKRLKDQADRNEVMRNAVQAQNQHDRMVDEHQKSLLDQRIPYAPFPDGTTPFQNPRATSNPEQVRNYPSQGPTRQIPPPSGQFPNQQTRYPQQRLTSSTEILEHLVPGSTKRGDFHSDPASNAMDTYRSSDMNYDIAIPSRGLPGPFSYISSARVDLSERLSERHRIDYQNQPIGKKNPVKRSSDDARKCGVEVDGRRLSIGRRRPSQLSSVHMIPSPRPMYTPIQMHNVPQSFAPPPFPIGEPVWQGQQQRESFKGQFQIMQNPIHASSGDNGQLLSVIAPVEQTIDDVAAPPDSIQPGKFSGNISSQQMATDPTGLPKPAKHHNDVGNQLRLGENVLSAASRPQVSMPQSRDPQEFEQQMVYDNAGLSILRPSASESQVPPSNFTIKEDETAHQEISERSRHPVTPRRSFGGQKHYKLRLFGIPAEFDKSAVMKMLEPCQGLIDVTELAFNKADFFKSVLAVFRSEVDAEEAKQRIPPTRFPELADGRFLLTRRCYKNVSTPSRDPYEVSASAGQNTPNASPTKTPQIKSTKNSTTTEASRRKGHGRKPSEHTTSKMVPLLGTKDIVDGGNTCSAGIESEEIITQARRIHSYAKAVTGSPVSQKATVAHSPSGTAEKPASLRISMSEDPFTTHSGNNPGPIVPSTNQKTDAQGTENDHAHNAPRNPHKTSGKKYNKKNSSKSSTMSQKPDGVQTAEMTSISENTKPLPSATTFRSAKSFLGEAALPEQGNDAANLRDADIEISGYSTSTGSNARGISTKAEQLSNWMLPPRTSSLQTKQEVEQGIQMSTSDPAREAGLLEEPSSPKRPESGDRQQSRATSLNAPNLVKGEHEESTATANIQGASSDTRREEDSASLDQPFTAPTSRSQPERTNSIASQTQSSVPSLIQPFVGQVPKNAGLNTDPGAFGGKKGSENTSLSYKSSTIHGSNVSPAAPESSREPIGGENSSLGDMPEGAAPDYSAEENVTSARVANPSIRSDSSVLPPTLSTDKIHAVSEKSVQSPPKPSAPDPNPSRSPETKQGPLIAPQLDLQQSYPVPIQTRRKKKPKQFTRAQEQGDTSESKGSSAEHQADDEALASERSVHIQNTRDQTTSILKSQSRPTSQAQSSKDEKVFEAGSKTSDNVSGLSIMPSLRPPSPGRSRGLPEPETPFKIDGKVILPVLRIPKPVYEANSEAEPMSRDFPSLEPINTAPSTFGWQNEEITRMVDNLAAAEPDYLHPSKPLSSDSSYYKSFAHGQEGIEASLVESGYKSLNEPCICPNFVVRDPDLARLEIFENMLQKQNDTDNTDNADVMDEDGNVYVVGDGGKVFNNRLQNLRQQFNQQELLQTAEHAAAGRGAQLDAQSPTPKSNSSWLSGSQQENSEEMSNMNMLKGVIEEIATEMTFAKAVRGEREIVGSIEDDKIKEAQRLLEASPRRRTSKTDAKNWESRATQYIEENISSHGSPFSTPERTAKTSNVDLLDLAIKSVQRSRSKEERSGGESPTPSAKSDISKAREPYMKQASLDERSSEGKDRDLETGKLGKGTVSTPKSSYPATSGSDGKNTPTSPQTLLGDRTPSPKSHKGNRAVSSLSPQALNTSLSRERQQQIPDTPSPSRSHQGAGDLGTNLSNVKDVASSALRRKGKDRPSRVDANKVESGLPPHSIGTTTNRNEENTVGIRGQNSGAKSSEMQGLVQEEDIKKMTEVQQNREQEQALHKIDDEMRSIEETQPMVKETLESASHATNGSVPEENPQYLSPGLEQVKEEIHNSENHGTQATKAPNLSDGESSLKANSLIENATSIGDHQARNPSNGQEIVDDLQQDAALKEPGTITPEKQSGTPSKGHQDDSEYPVLTRGGKFSTKGGKSRSPIRGGYAAAARTTINQRVMKQERKQDGKKSNDDDPWATPTEDIWGGRRGRGDGRRQLPRES